MRRAASVLVFVALVACSGDPKTEGTIGMTAAHRFDPETVTVKVGETVTWENTSGEQHTVTAVQGSIPNGAEYFASGGASSESGALEDLAAGLMDEGETFSVTFDTPGEYHYYCIPHRSEGMEGTVIVTK